MKMKQLARKLKILLKNNKIVDIVLFGSFAKGKINSKDIDIIVLTEKYDKSIKDKINQISKKKKNIQFISIKDYDHYIWLTLIKEGFSIKHMKYLFEIYKIKPMVLFKYSLKQLPISKKVMFERAIKTFNNITKLSNRVVLVPIKESSDFSDFLKNWKIDIDSQEYELLPLVRKEMI